jgi:acetyl-CoA acetyltransferase
MPAAYIVSAARALTGGRYGLQTMCAAGGQANATILERL